MNVIQYPAHPSNYYRPNEAPYYHAPNAPKGLVLHTPEEPADAVESTPAFFAQPNRAASTHYYGDNDGDLYQLVPENCAAIANGVIGKPYPTWADPTHSLNWQSLSIEIEGYAATIQDTITPQQMDTLTTWIADCCRRFNIPCDRQHVIGHYEVSNERTDPGTLFPWDKVISRALDKLGDDVYNIHYVRATKGIWIGRPLHILASQDINAHYDFNLPSNAKGVRIEWYLQSGYLIVFNGKSASPAGRVGWGVDRGKPSYGSIEVDLTQEGWFAIRAEDTTNPAVILDANSVAYWT